MKRRPSGSASRPSRVLALVVLTGALVMSVPAGCSAVRFWRRLPIPSVQRLGRDQIQAAFDRVNRAMPTDAREGLAVRRASETLAGAMHGAVTQEELSPTLAVAVGVLSRSQVGRLQLAAARLWLLEQSGEPVAKWRPAVSVYLNGLRRADLGHYQTALTRHWATAYQAAGLDAGTAYLMAEDLVGYDQGAFLQFLVPRLRQIITEREAAGDTDAAVAYRSVLHSLLRQWTLDPGPAGLRLLAADLLAGSLETDAGTEDVAQRRAIAESLRRWRSDYHEAARRLPIAVLDPHRRPALAPVAHERLVARVGLVTWLGSASLTAAIVALLCSWPWLSNRTSQPSAGGLAVLAIGVALIATIGGLLWINLRPESIRQDLRCDFSSLRYWWRHPFAVAGLTLVLLVAGGLLQRRGGRLAGRMGAVAAGTWLLLAVVLWSCTWTGELARRDYERALRAAYEDPVAAVLGPDAERALAELRRWNP